MGLSGRGEHLTIDPQGPPEEVDPVDGQPQHLALSQAGEGGKLAGDPVGVGHGVEQCPHHLRAGKLQLNMGFAGQDDSHRRGGADQTVPGRR